MHRSRQGESAVEEDTFNGEPLPRGVAVGDTIYAGTVNVEAALEARVLGSYLDSRLAALQRSVELAQTDKPRLARLADRIASWFVGAVLLVTAATALVWSQLAPDQAFWITLSVLVISCPCALALATPAALTSAASALRARRRDRARRKCAGGAVPRHPPAVRQDRHPHRGIAGDRPGATARQSCRGRRSWRSPLPCSSTPATRSRGHFRRSTREAASGRCTYQVGAGLEARDGDHTYRMGSEQFCRELAATLPPPPDDTVYWIALCRDDAPAGLDRPG